MASDATHGSDKDVRELGCNIQKQLDGAVWNKVVYHEILRTIGI